MILRSMALSNFRRFESLEIDFHPSLTVVVARNGQGKTTVLDAVAAALGPFVGAFENGKAPSIARSDARFMILGELGENEQQFPVRIRAQLSEPNIEWERARNGAKGRTTTKEAAPLSDWGKQLQSALRTDAEVELPVVAYYSSQRLWVSKKNTQKSGTITASRTMGYEDCLASTSSFRQMAKWLGDATLALVQQKKFRGYSPEALEQRLDGIAHAVDAVLEDEGWSGFHFSVAHGEPAMFHPDHGVLPLMLLSDGLRAMVSLTADLAFRCVRLNGQFRADAPSRTKGVVLIDEVDLHLHPAWQQRVMPSLMRAFPKIQFIVSTHSPQVISTISSESIRVIQPASDFDESGRYDVYTPIEEVEGVSSAAALDEIFGVDPVPTTKWSAKKSEYLALVQSGHGELDEATELRSDLESHFGPKHPWMHELDQALRLQALQRRFRSSSREQGGSSGSPEGGGA